MSKLLHQEFIVISSKISPKLNAAIVDCGPVTRRRSNHQPLPEVLCRTIAGQQLSVKAARTIWGRVLEDCGDRPLMDHVSAVDIERLRGCGLSRSKGKAMKAIAAAHDGGRLDCRVLGQMETQERSSALTSIWGVGQWTADMLSIFYFGDHDVWPENDVTVCKTLERLTDRRRKTVRTASRFAPQRSLLAMYMWRIADATPNRD